MKLHPLLLDDNISAALRVVQHVSVCPSRRALLDASGLLAIDPTAACLVAYAARLAQHTGKELAIEDCTPTLKQIFDHMNCKLTYVPPSEPRDTKTHVPTLALSVPSRDVANSVANHISARIAEFIPAEDRREMQDHYGCRIYHQIQPALAYVFSELVDNVFSHAQTVEFPDPMAWVAAKWYPAGDLVRVAVVDDGCGLLGSLRALTAPPRNHFEATAMAFRPRISSKSDRNLYTERSHLGLGLPICRDICQRLGGRIYVASGNALITDPGLERQENRRLDFAHQGTIVSLEFHRRAATTRTLPEILEKYRGSPDLRPRFDP